MAGHSVQRSDKHLVGAFHRNTGIARRFQGADHRDVIPFAVEAMGQGMQEGGLTRLPGGMNGEVLPYLDQSQDLRVQMPKRIHHIVPLRVAQAGRIEETPHDAKVGIFRRKSNRGMGWLRGISDLISDSCKRGSKAADKHGAGSI